jgi:hypothetical protein
MITGRSSADMTRPKLTGRIISSPDHSLLSVEHMDQLRAAAILAAPLVSS